MSECTKPVSPKYFATPAILAITQLPKKSYIEGTLPKLKDMKKILFQESQQFSQLWLWALLGTMTLAVLWGIFQQAVLGKPFGDNPMPTPGLFVLLLLPLGILALFSYMRLITIIDDSGISIRFVPFDKRFIPWSDIDKAYVRTYSPLLEYGGWGIRFSLKGRSMAYNVSGNKGLQLELKDGRKVLIGTRKAEELEQVLKAVFREDLV